VPELSHCGWVGSVPRAGRAARQRRRLSASLAVGWVCLAQCLCLPLLIGVDGGRGRLHRLQGNPGTEERKQGRGDQREVEADRVHWNP